MIQPVTQKEQALVAPAKANTGCVAKCVANITAAVRRCLGIKTPTAPVEPKPIAPAPKVQSRSLLKTALVGTAVLAVVGGGSFAAYKNIPAVQSTIDSALAAVKGVFVATKDLKDSNARCGNRSQPGCTGIDSVDLGQV